MNKKKPIDLESLIESVRRSLAVTPADLSSVKNALHALVSFLAGPQGRTDPNCKKTDLYFTLHDEHGFNWEHLPEPYQLILDDIGGQLHDTLGASTIAENFESTPEQLLVRIERLQTNG
jgi:hypothetical protein